MSLDGETNPKIWFPAKVTAGKLNKILRQIEN